MVSKTEEVSEQTAGDISVEETLEVSAPKTRRRRSAVQSVKADNQLESGDSASQEAGSKESQSTDASGETLAQETVVPKKSATKRTTTRKSAAAKKADDVFEQSVQAAPKTRRRTATAKKAEPQAVDEPKDLPADGAAKTDEAYQEVPAVSDAKLMPVSREAASASDSLSEKAATVNSEQDGAHLPTVSSDESLEAKPAAPVRRRRVSRVKAAESVEAVSAQAVSEAPAMAEEAASTLTVSPDAESASGKKRVSRRSKKVAATEEAEADTKELAQMTIPMSESESAEVSAVAQAADESGAVQDASPAESASEAKEQDLHAEAAVEASKDAETEETERKPKLGTVRRRREKLVTPSPSAKAASQKKEASEEKSSKDEVSQKGEAASSKYTLATKKQRKTHGKNHQNNKEILPSLSMEELLELKAAELRAKAQELGMDVTGLKKAELVEAVYQESARQEGFREVSGILDILSDGYGFLRTQGYLPSETDCYVSLSLIRRTNLRKGDYICGQTRPMKDNEKYAAVQKIISINGLDPKDIEHRIKFADLTPVYPDERLLMEHGKNTTTARVIDLVAPIGKGQRGLIVSPPKAGKTTVLKDIAASISANNPEVHLMCLLVDERPEEVTDMERSIKGEVVSSTFDMPCENHIAVAELVIERAKRFVEMGKDVVILLDSITRLARAYNLAQPASGRVLSGGVDSTALYPPKRFLGAARNIEGGGSLTILASALIDTGSKMDEVIFEEFKGTGNMELKLDRNLADRRIFPAIDAVSSGTRKEELLLNPQEAPLIWAVRRILANLNNTERATDMLVKSIKQTQDNQEFLIRTARKAQTNKAGIVAEL